MSGGGSVMQPMGGPTSTPGVGATGGGAMPANPAGQNAGQGMFSPMGGMPQNAPQGPPPLRSGSDLPPPRQGDMYPGQMPQFPFQGQPMALGQGMGQSSFQQPIGPGQPLYPDKANNLPPQFMFMADAVRRGMYPGLTPPQQPRSGAHDSDFVAHFENQQPAAPMQQGIGGLGPTVAAPTAPRPPAPPALAPQRPTPPQPARQPVRTPAVNAGNPWGAGYQSGNSWGGYNR